MEEQGTALAWRNLTVQVTEWSTWKPKKKTILRGLTGSVQAGTLTGLLGPSGAGKTTLLKVLSGGDLRADGQSEMYANEKSPSSYYIAQHITESIVGELTVGQILKYAYRFKNGLFNCTEKMNTFIASVLESLLLDDSLLERPFSICSGGEQKRIAIAQELMTSKAPPAFLFLDEPTTGLDSSAAFEVVASLRKLAQDQSITVIASIHAPNSETLALFDQLYILAIGGVAIFSGPPASIRDWLESSLNVVTPPDQPPIEALIKVACSGITESDVLQLANLTLKKCSFGTKPIKHLLPLLCGLPNPRKSFNLGDLYLSICRLCRITFLAKRRSLLLTLTIFSLYLVVLSSAFSTSMITQSGCVSLAGDEKCPQIIEMFDLVSQNVFFLSMVLIFTGVITIRTSAVTFASTIKVFRSEHRNGWYSLGSFYTSSLCVTFLEVTLYALLNGSGAYLLSGQHTVDGDSFNWSRFGIYLFFMWLLTVYIQSVGQIIGLLLVNYLDVAIVLSLVYYMAASMINGLFVDTETKNNVLLQRASSLIAFKFISRGILYAIFGIDRCDFEKERSAVFIIFHVDPQTIAGDILRVLLNILVVRLATILVLFLKFGFVEFLKSRKSGRNVHTINDASKTIAISLNFPENNNVLLSSVDEGAIKKSYLKISESTSPLTGKILLAWRNLSLYASSPFFKREIHSESTHQQTILRNLNGQVTFGSFNALMGTSGAGKTSLLKVLNGRYKTRLSNESVFHLSRYSPIKTCFITQDVSEHLPSGLTAKQMVTYASRFKNKDTSERDHEEIASKWLAELDLTGAAGTMVDACSGGERKRLAVALELTALAMPNCVCIDEPTSGLDSNSAEKVISILYKLTRSHPMAIIASIHQPTNGILQQFDQLYILARGGLAIYSGPPSGMAGHLEAALSPREEHFPYSIEALIKYSCSGNQTEQTVQALVTLTKQTQISSEVELAVSREAVPISEGIGQNRVRFSLSSVRLLIFRYFRTFWQHYRKEQLFYSINYLFYGLALPLFYCPSMVSQSGCIDLQADFNAFCSTNLTMLPDSVELLNNFKYSFFAGSFFFSFILLQSSLSFLRQLSLFRNEHRNGWYSTGSFYLAKSTFDYLCLLPVLLLYVATFSRWYETISPGIYWSYLYLFLLSAAAFQAFSHIGALFVRGSIPLLIIIGSSLFLFTILLSNFFLLYPRVVDHDFTMCTSWRPIWLLDDSSLKH